MSDIPWTLIERFPLDKDLMPFLRHLTVLGISCHVVEADNQQQLLIRDTAKLAEVQQMTSQWQQGDLPLLGANHGNVRPKPSLNKAAFIKALPVTLLTILLGFVGAALVALDQRALSYAQPFLFQPIVMGNLFPVEVGIERGEYWRIITPMFLHFGIVHIAFNSLLIWLIGHRIEIAKGSLHLALVLILTGIVANITQFVLTPNTVFGGLSGAAYGLVGYIMVYQRLIKHPILHFSNSMLIVLMISLLLGVFGIFDLFLGDSGIANGAHVGGLLVGMLVGLIVAYFDKPTASDSHF